jgi:hypothetical protein
MNETTTTNAARGGTARYALPVDGAAWQLSADTQSSLDESEAAERLWEELTRGPR